MCAVHTLVAEVARELIDTVETTYDEPFEVAGLKAMYPSGFGKASEDINCRCVVLEIARWELDVDEGFTKIADGRIVSFSNAKDYGEFRKKYYEEVKK